MYFLLTRHILPHHTGMCAICHNTIRDPVELNCPGFCKYCRECTLEWFGGCSTNKCPKCNVNVTAMKYGGGAVPLRMSNITGQRPRSNPKKTTSTSTNKTTTSNAMLDAMTTPSPTKVVSQLLSGISPTKVVKKVPAIARYSTYTLSPATRNTQTMYT